MANKNVRNKGFTLVTTKSGASVSRKSGRTVIGSMGRTAKAVRSAVSFYKETVKNSDIRGIMEDLSRL